MNCDALAIEVVRKTVTVDCTIEEAFRIFTRDAVSWWPVETHSIHGPDAREIVFETGEGGEVYELSASGEREHWATVVEWQPPSRLVLAWNILNAEDTATEVEVRFEPEGTGTRVDLEHRGWEALGEPGAEKRDKYDAGWDQVLGLYQRRVG